MNPWIIFLYFTCKIWSISSETDPDVYRTTCEIVVARGFDCEIHYVTTNQDYIVQMHRVISPSPDSGKNPVILQTGLIGTSADFIFATDQVSTHPEVVGQNMGIELAKQGYDVWLSNNRGSIYGLNHTTLTPDDAAFWNFSFDEISQYDTPAFIDFVLAHTGKDRLHFIGHSQGTSVMFGLLSQTSQYNSKVQTFIAISPVAQIGAALTSFRYLVASLDLVLPNDPSLAVFTSNPLTTSWIPFSCGFPAVNLFCQGVFFSITGPNYDNSMNISRLPVYLAHMPTSTSAKNLLHFDQMFKTNLFRKYDYGYFWNIYHYGWFTPPNYVLQDITHPNIVVIYALNDWFVPSNNSFSGVVPLQNQLPSTTVFYQIPDPWANHMDALIGIEDAVQVNEEIITILS